MALSPLAVYLDKTKTSSAAFAAKLQVDQTAVMRWRKGERHPRTEMAFLIESVTRGAVTAKSLAEYAKSRPVLRGGRSAARSLPKHSSQ